MKKCISKKWLNVGQICTVTYRTNEGVQILFEATFVGIILSKYKGESSSLFTVCNVMGSPPTDSYLQCMNMKANEVLKIEKMKESEERKKAHVWKTLVIE